VRKAKPDILVSTGDLVDGEIDELSSLVSILSEINPRYGKFAVTGNHEFYAGLNQAIRFTEKAGFILLRGASLSIGDVINIVGVDDRQGKSYGIATAISERELLMDLPREKFTILLKHRPLVNPDAIGLFDLQLSGHVHKGQIFPFSIITGMYYSTQDGFAELQDGSHIYVSRGSGTWGPPIRFLSPPEVTIIELSNRKNI
jgi:predicted MPP superfamily phosphohydrolase